MKPDEIETLAGQVIFTLGEVAKICRVAPRTAAKWFDSGELKGYRIPGSRDRRITRESLLSFLRRHNMPYVFESDLRFKVLVVAKKDLAEEIRGELDGTDFEVLSSNGLFEAGIEAASHRFTCVVVDFGLGRREALCVASHFRDLGAGIIGLLSSQDDGSGIDDGILAEVFRHPFHTALVAERVVSIVDRLGVN